MSISSPIIDADVSILKPVLMGELTQGGLITDQPQKLVLLYNC